MLRRFSKINTTFPSHLKTHVRLASSAAAVASKPHPSARLTSFTAPVVVASKGKKSSGTASLKSDPMWADENITIPIPQDWYESLEKHRSKNKYDSNRWLTHIQGHFREQGRVTLNRSTTETVTPNATTSTNFGVGFPLSDVHREHNTFFINDLPLLVQESIWQHHPLTAGQLEAQKWWLLDLSEFSIEEIERRYSNSDEVGGGVTDPISPSEDQPTSGFKPFLFIPNLLTSNKSVKSTSTIQWKPAAHEEASEALAYNTVTSSSILPSERLLIKSKAYADRLSTYNTLSVFNAQESSNPFALDTSLSHKHALTGEEMPINIVPALTSAYSLRQFRCLKWLPATELSGTSWKPIANEASVRAQIERTTPILHCSQLPKELQHRLRSRLPSQFIGRCSSAILRWGYDRYRFERTITAQIEKQARTGQIPDYPHSEISESIWIVADHFRSIFPETTLENIGNPKTFDFCHTDLLEFYNLEQLVYMASAV